MKIEKASGIGFCFGARRAIDILEKVACQSGGVETLGAVVHNQEVLQRLAGIGVRVAKNVEDIKGATVVISAHGISPQLEEKIHARNVEIIDTTCPVVHRAQLAAQKLAESGFFVVIYGDAEHPEVKGVLGWAKNNGLATLDEKAIAELKPLPRRLGILSQTTQIPTRFTEFAKRIIDTALVKGSEIRIIDTICHDIRTRQTAALKLAKKVDLMLVIGGHNSANTRHLVELCSTATKTYLVENAEEIQPDWLKNKKHIGITAGASTDEQTINEVLTKLEKMA